jgi:hypothetical protein
MGDVHITIHRVVQSRVAGMRATFGDRMKVLRKRFIPSHQHMVRCAGGLLAWNSNVGGS